MPKTFFLCMALLAALNQAEAADLTETETRWLHGVWPVVAFARERGLPLDIVVQPQDTPGAAPLALGFVDGRCKLVFSMRGNAEAQATLDRIGPELLAPALELMAAHEMGHCHRYLDGAWYGSPVGFRPAVPAGLSDARRAAWMDEAAARREEAYGDLVGLMWTWQRHPEQYARLHDWLESERSTGVLRGSPHDTRLWVALAGIGNLPALSPTVEKRDMEWSIFVAADALWREGLAATATDVP